jgi:hypothetical protein
VSESVAFLVMAHGDPWPLSRLLCALERFGGHRLVHYDARSPSDQRREVERLHPDVHFVPAIRCHWGDFSLVAASLRLIEAAYKRTSAERFFLISGDTYPTMDPLAFQAWLDERSGMQVIDSTPLPNPLWDHGGLDRVNYYRVLRPGRLARLTRLNGAIRLLQDVSGVRRRPPTPAFGGSQFWSLTRECALWCVDSEEAEAAQRFFRRTAIPDELYFQSLVAGSPWNSSVILEYTIYIDYSYYPSFVRTELDAPKVLTERDYPRIIASGKPFARKLRSPDSDSLYSILTGES